MNAADIVTRIEQRIEALGISARAASLKAKLSGDAIRNWQRRLTTDPATVGITVDALQAIARALDVDFVWLLTGEADPSPAKPAHSFAEDAVPFTGPAPDASPLDPARGHPTPAQALFAAKARHASITHRAVIDLPGFGINSGDLLVCDLSRLPVPGELAITVLVDTNTGTSQTMIRRYAPPFLLGGELFSARAEEIATAGLDVRYPVIGAIRGS